MFSRRSITYNHWCVCTRFVTWLTEMLQWILRYLIKLMYFLSVENFIYYEKYWKRFAKWYRKWPCVRIEIKEINFPFAIFCSPYIAFSIAYLNSLSQFLLQFLLSIYFRMLLLTISVWLLKIGFTVAIFL